MHLQKCLFSCAIALLLATYGKAGNLVPTPQEPVSSARDGLIEGKRLEPDNSSTGSARRSIISRPPASMPAVSSVSDAAADDAKLASQNHQLLAVRRIVPSALESGQVDTPQVDPLLVPTPVETGPSDHESAVDGSAVDEKVLTPRTHPGQTTTTNEPYLSVMPAEEFPLVPDLTSQIGSQVPNISGVGKTYIDPSCAGQLGSYLGVSVEALLWRLESTQGQPMIINPVLGETIRTDDLDLGCQPGLRVNLAIKLDDEESVRAIEVSYIGVHNWFDSITEVAPAGSFLRLPDTLGNVGVTTDFAEADQMEARYDAHLNSVELNFVFGKSQSNFQWMLGPRFIQLKERFNLDSFTDGRVSYYNVDTKNNLLGVQWVGRWQQTYNYWEFNTVFKLGVFSNQAHQWTLMTDNNRTKVIRDYEAVSRKPAAVLDAGINAAYHLNGTWLARIGYNVLVMDSVARAPDQLDFSNTPGISGNEIFFRNDALAHGLNLGVEARW